ncbi:iron ABC transporter permease [Plantactinospora mayteni]|uniref:Iron (III)-transporter permease HitB n=1 Tax=Plantactinospora mayteni TaxID=566021 RepID=A0ABQ4F229_9ACTN|nr:iron ABC transporter permease [Plantactinospora mayteni]GIH00957.1 iron (III)-transporter permease HitB [Plantactinospora mayteni]
MTVTSLARRWGARTSGYPVAVAVTAAAVAALTLIPLGYVAWFAVGEGWHAAYQQLVRPRVGELLWNTARLAVAAMTASAVLGTAAAWLTERTDLPGRRVWHVLLAVPLAVPAFVNSFGWVSLSPAVEGYGGAVLVVTLSYYPLVYLPAAATLRGLDPALEDTARALGLSPTRVFLRVVVPQLRPAILGGTLLVGLHLLAEFGALQMLRFPTFTTAIYDQYQATFNGPTATMLGSVLVVACLLLLVAELRLRGRVRHARLGPGSARRATPVRLGRRAPVALTAVAGIVVLALGVPLASLAYWLVTGTSTRFPVADLTAATVTTLGLGVAGAAVTVTLALPVAWLTARRPGRTSTAIERASYFGSALPGIIVALALITVCIRHVPALYQTTAMLLAAYAILFMPRAVVSLRAALAHAPPHLDDAARALGSGPLTVAVRVTLPLIAPGIGAGAALVFLAITTELTSTLLLAPIGTATLATQFWANSDAVAYGGAAPYAALMVILSAPMAYLLTQTTGRIR